MLPVYKRSWILGEGKYVELEVCSTQKGEVTIPSASWSLTPETAAEAEQSGACEVEGNRIRALIEPQKTGNYTLEITYELQPETRKVRVMVDVH